MLRKLVRRVVPKPNPTRAFERRAGVPAVDAQLKGGLPIVEVHGRLTLGKRLLAWTRLDSPPSLYVAPGAELHIGDDVFLNFGCSIQANLSITIGDRTMIGDRATLMDTAYHEVAPGEGVVKAPIVIGNAVWIAHGATVLPGVTIGEGSVVAAGAVVTKDVPAGVVVAGVPARVVREIGAVPPGYRRHGPFPTT
jgi:acetyltransferase-like isoleucine patch superfamily enzyme